ncbi:hypothetical protein RA086_04905 [Lactiplantibacillus sp. WILCCON 0030]|uniref:DUF1659 domain-containing protein n=1 Tax=Lactiplantibacillus brownii TaxID=3069269 RepID=A0ABU1A963_9LACO|nr:hypothetical protein [Lactiplantibacillus brownii]MDQ7936982.1 hypothetical protein [Lactiplantibacillus brownii]
MNKTWLKSTLAVELKDRDNVVRKQTFTAITQEATNEQLTTFGKALETLTGQTFDAAKITNFYQYDATVA